MLHTKPNPNPDSRARAPGAWTIALVAIVTSCDLAASAAAARGAPPAGAAVDPRRFGSTIDNRYLPLVPGTTFRLIETLGRSKSDIEIAVTPETKVVLGVHCVVVRERVWERGRLTQTTDTWHAQDAEGTVWIFGEDAKEFLDRGRVSTEGSWEAGVDGAQPGVVMPGRPSIGATYAQGYAAGVAEDRAEVVALDDSVRVPFGRFGGCLKTKEWSMLESGTDRKWYAPGIGLVRALSAAREETVLVSVSRP